MRFPFWSHGARANAVIGGRLPSAERNCTAGEGTEADESAAAEVWRLAARKHSYRRPERRRKLWHGVEPVPPCQQ